MNLRILQEGRKITSKAVCLSILLENSGSLLLKPGNFSLSLLLRTDQNLKAEETVKPKSLVFPGRSRKLDLSFPNPLPNRKISEMTLTLSMNSESGDRILQTSTFSTQGFQMPPTKARKSTVQTSSTSLAELNKLKAYNCEKLLEILRAYKKNDEKVGKWMVRKLMALKVFNKDLKDLLRSNHALEANQRSEHLKTLEKLLSSLDTPRIPKKNAARKVPEKIASAKVANLVDDSLVITVKPGDSLFKIARTFLHNGNLYPLLAQANGLAKPYIIHPGQKLYIGLELLNMTRDKSERPLERASEALQKTSVEKPQNPAPSTPSPARQAEPVSRAPEMASGKSVKKAAQSISDTLLNFMVSLPELTDDKSRSGKAITPVLPKKAPMAPAAAVTKVKPSEPTISPILKMTAEAEREKITATAETTSESVSATAPSRETAVPSEPEKGSKTEKSGAPMSRKIGIIALILSLFVIILGRLRIRNSMKRKRAVIYHENPLEKLR